MTFGWRAARRAALAGVAALALVAPAQALRVQGTSVTLEWSPASGSVDGYVIWVSTNGGPFLLSLGSELPRVTVTGAPGDTLRVRVAAYGPSPAVVSLGPVSEPSDLIILAAAEDPPSPPDPIDPPDAPDPDPDPDVPDAPAGGLSLDPARTGGDWRFAATGDFDGDGRADLLTREAATGQVQVWLLNDVQIVGGGHLGWTEPGDRLHVGDYDGDGQSDVLVQRARPEYPTLWFVSEAEVVEQDALWDAKLWPDWRLSVGDFNADGRDDLFVLDPETGKTEQLLLAGAELLRRDPLPTLTEAATRFPFPGDFDGDGLGDVLLFNQGQQEVWLSNASGPPSRQSLITTDESLRVSTGDINGDAQTDVIYHDPVTDEVTVWYLEGSHRLSEGDLSPVPGNELLESVDLDADGRDDLLVHSPDGPELDVLLLP